MPIDASISYITLTAETERVIEVYMARAATADHPIREQLYQDVALGAFLLWTRLACEASLLSTSPTAHGDYEADRQRLEALTQTGFTRRAAGRPSSLPH